jgi:hypothetical protein
LDGAFVHSSPLSWIARNSSKPGRDPSTETWVLHASADWSCQNLEANADDVAKLLWSAFGQATQQPLPEPISLKAHRWRYALAKQPLEIGCLWDSQMAIGACGDWCAGNKVEGAFVSGLALAGRILGHAASSRQLLPLYGAVSSVSQQMELW